MKNTKRKGFTIVELVIVIAVIAILAAVLIPTFASLINKANRSADIQAVHQMNTALAVDEVTSNQTIFDVYDALAELGMDAEDYKPLASNTYFFWDSSLNRVVYTDKEYNVTYPENVTVDKNCWYSLSMKGVESKQPTGTNYTKAEASNSTNAKITATVSSAEEYLYVIERYNEISNNGSTALDLELTISGTIDMKGTQCTIAKTRGKITIKGDSNATLKNITSVETHSVSSENTQKKDAAYNTSALIADSTFGNVEISGITLENAYVRTFEGGNVALLIGSANGADLAKNPVEGRFAAKISNVTIKNSAVIGHRSVGALVGNAQGSGSVILDGGITLENVAVKCIGGKSARLIGTFGNSVEISNTTVKTDFATKRLVTNGITLKQTNVSLDIYTHNESNQTYSDTCPTSVTNLEASGASKFITSYKKIAGKNLATYPYFEDVDVVCVKVTDSNEEYFAGYSISNSK